MKIIREGNIFYLVKTIRTIFSFAERVKVVNEAGEFVRYGTIKGDVRDVDYDVDWYKTNDDYLEYDLQINFQQYYVRGTEFIFRYLYSSVREPICRVIDEYFPEYDYTYTRHGRINWLTDNFNLSKDNIIEQNCEYSWQWGIYGIADIRSVLTCDRTLDYGKHNNRILNAINNGKPLSDSQKVDIMIRRLNNYKSINSKTDKFRNL